ncbi:hypothetical protein [Haladaptatus cibarius]|uniref:hypothetical protein n=1 Tax=Haladaptatus cibarius TaxID=453847 RepID=UPI000679890E|nr:hypothetical protein [Haladaptatus cibarius]
METDGRLGKGHGELADAIQFTLFPLGDCDNCDGKTEAEARTFVRDSTPENSPHGEFEPFAQGRLCDVLASTSGGHLLDDAPKTPGTSGLQPGRTYYVGFRWWVPETVDNEIQSDSVSFDLEFYAEQCRRNPNPANPFAK